jgi:hypothetical protein
VAWRGRFRPKNPTKYKGDPNGIVYRSSLELKVMRRLDENESVIWWASEEVVVPYFDPVQRRARRYFPDFVVCRRDPDLGQVTIMIEVKPSSETRPPVHRKGKRRTRVIAEELTWANNQAKWQAAEAFCARNGWRFVKLTEKEIGQSY